jgi:hypothetical protein
MATLVTLNDRTKTKNYKQKDNNMKVTFTLIALLFYLFTFAQPTNSKLKLRDTTLVKIEKQVYLLNRQVANVDSQLTKTNAIQIETLKKVSEDTFWADVKTNLVASFIYDILGFNGNTPGSLIAKCLSLLYLLYLCLKARYWWKTERHKKSETPFLDFFGGIVTCLQAAFSIFVFFASFLFSNNDLLDKAAFNEANKNIQILNKQIQNMKEVDFVVLSENLKRVQQLKMDTLSSVDISYLTRLENKIVETNSLTQTQLKLLTQKADSLQMQIKANTLPKNYAKSGWQQAVQTGLLLLIAIALFIFLRDDFKRKGYI